MSEHMTREQLDAAAKVELEKINALRSRSSPRTRLPFRLSRCRSSNRPIAHA